MPTLSERAAAALVRRQKAAFGVAVTITRAGESIAVTAVPGATVYTSEADGGVRNEISARDYLVAVADYAFAAGPAVPQLGDRITEGINGEACTFEVQTPENGEKEWRYSSQWRVMYRLHCKNVSSRA